MNSLPISTAHRFKLFPGAYTSIRDFDFEFRFSFYTEREMRKRSRDADFLLELLDHTVEAVGKVSASTQNNKQAMGLCNQRSQELRSHFGAPARGAEDRGRRRRR